MYKKVVIALPSESKTSKLIKESVYNYLKIILYIER